MAAMDGELARHAPSGPSVPSGPIFSKPAGSSAASTSTSAKKKKKNKNKNKKATVSFAEEDEPSPASTAAAISERGKFKSISDLPTADDIDALSDDALAAMDAELRAALKESGADIEDDEEAEGLDEDGRREYGMMRDLLESFASQGGEAGVVGNLFGRLGEVQGKK